MLKISNLKKTYKMPNHTVHALKGISFDVNTPQLVAIVGPSGSGKTTLLNIMGALDSEFEGDVVINGKSLREARGKDLDTHRRDTVGFVFQHSALVQSLTGLQNVELAMELSNQVGKRKRAQGLLTQMGLSQHMTKKVNRLSGGQKQRVAIARALANDPSIILADEPTGALDSETSIQVMELLKDLSRTKLVVVITHSQELAAEFADRIISMTDGQITDIREVNQTTRGPSHQEQSKTTSKMSLGGAFKYALRGLWLKRWRTLATSIGTSIGIIGIALAIALTTGASSTFQAQITEVFPINNISVSKPSQDQGIGFGGGGSEPWTYAEVQEVLGLSEGFIAYQVGLNQVLISQEASLSRSEAESPEIGDDSIRRLDISRPVETIEDALFLGRMPQSGNYFEGVLPLNTAQALLEEDGDISTLLGQNLYIRFITGINPETEQPNTATVQYTIVGITSTNALNNSMFLISGANLGLVEELGQSRDDLTFSSLTVFSDPAITDIRTFLEDLNAQQDQWVFESTLESTISGVNAALAAIRNVLIGLSSISVLVALLMISIVIYISVLEKTQEIGIIRAIGGRMQDIRNIFLAESVSIGLLSGGIGVGIAYILSHFINLFAAGMIGGGMARFMPSTLRIARLTPLAAIGLVVLCVFLSIISGYIPARNAAKLDPVKAVRHK